MKAELGALMMTLFGEERTEQDAWLEKVARSSARMNTLRPPVMSRGTFESLPPLAGTSEPPSSTLPAAPSSAAPLSAAPPSSMIEPAPKHAQGQVRTARTFWMVVFVLALASTVAALVLLVFRWLWG